MLKLLYRYATPLVTGLFLASLISGIALFFHVGPAGMRPMHEWMSMVLVVPFALHMWRNWRPMTAYFRHAPMAVALAASLIASGLFLLPGSSEGTAGNPAIALLRQVTANSPAELAPLLGSTPDALIARLDAAGIAVRADQKLNEAADAAGKSVMQLAAALVPAAE